MAGSFRHFRAGPDIFGRIWQVDLLWLQNAVAIRRSDSVDVKFTLASGEDRIERVVSMRRPDLLRLSRGAGAALSDPWCMKLAARHIAYMIRTGTDFEKSLVTVEAPLLAAHAAGEEA